MQDLIAIAVSLTAVAWLVQALWKRFMAPPCRPPGSVPSNADGFVPLDDLKKNRSPTRHDGPA